MPLWTVIAFVIVAMTWRYAERPLLRRIASAVQLGLLTLLCIQLIWMAPAFLPGMGRTSGGKGGNPTAHGCTPVSQRRPRGTLSS